MATPLHFKSPTLERNVRELALAELRQSDETWQQYQSRRSNPLINWGIWIFRCLIIVSFFFAPMAFTWVALGLGNSTPQMALAFHSLQITAALMFLAAANDRAYFVGEDDIFGLSPPTNLRVLAYLPVSDGTLRRSCNLTLGVIVALVASCCFVFLYGYLAWNYTMFPVGWLISAGLSLLHLVTVTAAVIVVCAYSPVSNPKRLALLCGGFLVLFGCIMGIPGPKIPEAFGRVLDMFLYCLPSGWIGAVFAKGFVGNSPSAWLFLCPAFLLISFAYRLHRKDLNAGFRIREIVITGNHRAYGVIDPQGFRVPKNPPPEPILLGQSRGERIKSSADLTPSVVLESDAERLVLGGEYLREITASRFRFLQGVCDKCLTARERLLLRAWTTTYDLLTVQWLVLLAGITVVLLLIRVAVSAGLPPEASVLLRPIVIIPIMIARIWGTNNFDMNVAKLVIIYPVCFGEVAWASLKRELVRFLLDLPLVIGYGFIASYIAGIAPSETVLHCLLLRGVVFCGSLCSDSFRLSSMTNDTRKTRVLLFWVGNMILFSLMAATIIAGQVSPSVLLVSFTVLLLISCGMSGYYVRAYRRNTFDMLPK